MWARTLIETLGNHGGWVTAVASTRGVLWICYVVDRGVCVWVWLRKCVCVYMCERLRARVIVQKKREKKSGHLCPKHLMLIVLFFGSREERKKRRRKWTIQLSFQVLILIATDSEA